jgi:hypothetical protein
MFTVRYKMNFPITGLDLQVFKKLIQRYIKYVELEADYIQPHEYISGK